MGILPHRQNSRKAPKLLVSLAYDPRNVLASPIRPRTQNPISRRQLSLPCDSLTLADITCDTTSRLRVMTAGDTFYRLCQQCCAPIGREDSLSVPIGREYGGDLIGRLHYWCRHLAYLQLLVQLSPGEFATYVTYEEL